MTPDLVSVRGWWLVVQTYGTPGFASVSLMRWSDFDAWASHRSARLAWGVVPFTLCGRSLCSPCSLAFGVPAVGRSPFCRSGELGFALFHKIFARYSHCEYLKTMIMIGAGVPFIFHWFYKGSPFD